MALTDPRVTKQADILVNYSTKVKKGDRVLIVSDWFARPLTLEVYKKCILAGAIEVRVNFEVDEQVISRSYNEFAEIYLKYAKPFQINSFPKIADEELKNIDCWIRLYGKSNTRGFSNIDTKIISERAKVVRSLIDHRVLKTRWVITNFPTEAQAQDADMSVSEHENHVFDAINKVNWAKKFKEQEKLADLLSKTNKVRIIGPETDIMLGKGGRKAENAGGIHNMPDGEIFTSVVENKADGFITYTYPAVYMGKEFHKVRLEFKSGKVVKASAEKGERDLNRILDMDSGARTIGELGIGNNYAIKKFTKDILFDEKIGGSIHLALGKGYKETGSKNESALHWDMIKDLRRGGELWFDNKLVQKNGKWLIKLT
jgi:aminopeptidase